MRPARGAARAAAGELREPDPGTADDTWTHAATYLADAGWEWLDEAAAGELAMQLDGDDVTLAFHYAPATRSARLVVVIGCGDVGSQPLHDGSVDLRIEAESAGLLGLLCWITSHQGDLCAETAAEWLAGVAHLCPDTYAVVRAPGLPERLERVPDPGSRAHVLH